MLRRELLEVIRKYVKVEPGAVKVTVERQEGHELALSVSLPEKAARADPNKKPRRVFRRGFFIRPVARNSGLLRDYLPAGAAGPAAGAFGAAGAAPAGLPRPQPGVVHTVSSWM